MSIALGAQGPSPASSVLATGGCAPGVCGMGEVGGARACPPGKCVCSQRPD